METAKQAFPLESRFGSEETSSRHEGQCKTGESSDI
jgi:hypothetical protein